MQERVRPAAAALHQRVADAVSSLVSGQSCMILHLLINIFNQLRPYLVYSKY